ncbi:hypothetical protein HG537_0E02210 [Torulaspora globosa]|uniref:Uncharacterized protein n=1 Tax=Torulaspora globosa TaxID=48254 RepID=A0A7H9HV38_9SACH|nr:hypothetical protein HG537_0E02210 [Torulaspora sp. CBS 2947]
MTAASVEFNTFWKQLNSELQILSSEAKKRSNVIRVASDRSLEILKSVRSYEELSQYSEFVTPFVMSCSSKNAKLTTISMQCLQRLSSTPCLPSDRLSDVLDAFILATQLALDLKLKVLQVLPIFFKNYAYHICGPLCVKILKCCSDLLQSSNKSPMVVGTASATLQQLMDEIFERLIPNGSENAKQVENEKIYDVLVGNNESIKVDVYRHDANVLFSDLCSSFEVSDSSSKIGREPQLDMRNLPTDYGLEILESVLKNSISLFLTYNDLQFLLRTKTVPFLLRCIQSSMNFAIVVRSYRCIKLLIRKDYLSVLELELEVVLSLMIHGISVESETPIWKRVLSLEVFSEISRNFDLLCAIFMTYDNYSDKKHILTSFLWECHKLLSQEDMQNCLCESPIIQRMELPIVTGETFNHRTQLIHMLDKASPPPVSYVYLVWLILSISNEWSYGFSLAALELAGDSAKNNGPESGDLKTIYMGTFPKLFDISKKFLYSTALDVSLFHSVVRAFQKLAHAAGILSVAEQLNQCVAIFSVAIVKNTENWPEAPQIVQPQQALARKSAIESEEASPAVAEKVYQRTKSKLPYRNINQAQLSLFRALISLSVSLGQTLPPGTWTYVLKTWQWISYYVNGPSADFMEGFYLEDVPSPPLISKNDLITIENTTRKLLETTISYSDSGFKALVEKLISESNEVLTSCTKDETNKDSSLASIPACRYNKTFFITELGELTVCNLDRFANSRSGREYWLLISNYLTSLIADRNVSTVAIRLYASKTLTDIIRKTCIKIGELEDPIARNKKFQSFECLVIDPLMNSIEALKNLDITKDAIYSGLVRAESEILLQSLSTLKNILNEFGDIMTETWPTVFKIINSPFYWDSKSVDNMLSTDEDDSSLVNGIAQKHIEMIQISYDVFKLISDDFLQTLPLEVIKCVIDTIVHFVTQKQNLNISFSSLSQFWSLDDYFRMQESANQNEWLNADSSKFVDNVMKGKLMDIIVAKDNTPFELHYGLWLYLLKELTSCSEDERKEVKNGAIQTFFRIIDSHSAYFPNWKLIFLEVIKPLLSTRRDASQLLNDVEFWNHTLDGLVKLYPIHFGDFSDEDSAREEWITLLNFLQLLFNSGLPEVSYVAIVNYRILLEAMAKMEKVPHEVLEKCVTIWSEYDVVYNDMPSSNSPIQKNGYDCIQELITSFPYLYEIVTSYRKISVEFVEMTLNLFNSAVRYPLLPEHTKDNLKLSSLQSAVLSGLEIFSSSHDDDVDTLILYQLSVIITLSFETRERIEKKLLPKLADSSKARLPTFGAVSARALEIFNKRLLNGKVDSWGPLKEKYTIKIFKNLSEVIRRKSLIRDAENGSPIYVAACEACAILTNRIFGLLSTSKMSAQVQDNFFNVFIEITSSPLRRIDLVADSESEDFDANAYSTMRDIFIRQDVIGLFKQAQIEKILSSVWAGSFLYERDEIEMEIMDRNQSLRDLAKSLANFDFDCIAASTVETTVLSKSKCALICLRDLVRFVRFPEEQFEILRKLCAPYLVCRVAFVLRRFISHESLRRMAPIPKIRKLELQILIHGVHDIVEDLLTRPNSSKDPICDDLKLLHPLILRAMPLSHKLENLQKEVLDLSLGLTKLTSN